MKNLTVFLSITLLFLGALFSAFTIEGDQKAEKIISDSRTAFEKLTNFSASFSYSVRAATGTGGTLSRKGKLQLKKTGNSTSESKYYVKMADQEITCNGTNVWVLLREDGEAAEVIKYSLADLEESMGVTELFSLYEAEAESFYNGQKSIDGVNCHEIKMAVKDPNLEYNQATIWIGVSDKMVHKAMLKDRLQTQTTFLLSKIDTRTSISSATFEFNEQKYADILIDDSE